MSKTFRILMPIFGGIFIWLMFSIIDNIWWQGFWVGLTMWGAMEIAGQIKYDN